MLILILLTQNAKTTVPFQKNENQGGTTLKTKTEMNKQTKISLYFYILV